MKPLPPAVGAKGQSRGASVDSSHGARVMMLGTSPEMRGGVAAVVATLRDGGFFERDSVDYLCTHVDGSAIRKVFVYARGAIKALFAMVRGDVALVHAHMSSGGSFWRKFLLLLAARLFGIPTVCHLHDGRFATYARGGFGAGVRRAALRLTLTRSSTVIALSEALQAWVRDFAPAAPVEVLGNPVRCPDEATLVALRTPTGDEAVDADAGNILFLGKVCAEKGAFDLVEAFASFGRDYPSWRLLVGGVGETESLQALAAARGVGHRVDLLGWVSGPQKDAALAKATVFVLPSYAEGMPVAVLEAMAWGLPVIATPVGGVPDMMTPGEHGLWVSPGEVPQLVEALRQLASSAELRRRLGGAARAHVVARYSVEAIMARLREIYRAARVDSAT